MASSRQTLTVLFGLAVIPCFIAADWPQFRGPDSRSFADGQPELPERWTDHIAWQVELPGRGPSSPIVVSGRVLITSSSGAKQERLHVLCFDAKDGRQLWHRRFWATGRTFCHPTSANAAPTPASDGKRVFALYSSNDLVCLDLDGNLQWYRGLAYDYPKAGNDLGMASSPLVAGSQVIVQVENQGDSFAAALNTATGQTTWRLSRPPVANWSSPVLMRGSQQGRDLVLLQSRDGLSAHNPASGNEMWRYDAGCAGIASSTVSTSTAGTVYVPSQGITALRTSFTGGTPDVLWQDNRLQPSSPSPVVYQNKIYTVNSSGVLVCGDAQTGKILWRLRLKGGRFYATPVAAGRRLYLVNAEGLVQVVAISDEGELVETCEMGEPIQGSPAVSGDAIYLRSDKHLWKIAADAN